jgi:hypothetical protein
MGAIALWRAGLPGLSMRLYAKAHRVALVLGAKVGQDCLFLAVAYLLGMATTSSLAAVAIAAFWGHGSIRLACHD